jgi:hypothetical protein
MQRRAGVKDGHAPAQPGAAMERDRAHMGFIEMLVHLEGVGFMIKPTDKRLMQRRQNIADNVDYRPVHLRNRANVSEIVNCGLHG